MQEQQTLNPKTIDFFNRKANETEFLMEEATRYRTKLDESTTNFAKTLYKKKLTKIIKKLDHNINLISMLTSMNKAAESTGSEVSIDEGDAV